MNLKAAILVLICTLAATQVRAGDVTATVQLQPEEISLGQAGVLTLTVEGSARVVEPRFPPVEGLEITRVGKSTNIQLINETMSGGVTFTYQLVPEKTGVFTIPELIIQAGRETVKTPPVTLRVAKPFAGYIGPSAQSRPQSQSQPAPSSSSSSSLPDEISSKAVAFQINLPKRDFYVGELVPAELKVYLRHGLNITEVFTPSLSGNAFTIGKLNTQPDTSEDRPIDGNLYKILTWHTTVAPVKSGEYPLSVQMQVLVVEQDRSPFGDNFPADPFFDRFFRGERTRQVTLKSDDRQVKIVPLPEEGRPADFSGAIGQFELTADASPREVGVGDPVTLKLTIAGAGNFDRVKAPELGKNLGFKVYTPSSKFEPFDSGGQGGRKIFEQMVIPQNPSITAIPRITFSYFDPEKGKYLTLATSEIPLKLTSSGSGTPQPRQAPSAAVPKAESPAGFTASDNNLVAIKLAQGSVASTLAPVFFQPWFWGLQAVPLVGLIAAWWVFRRRDRLKYDLAFARSVSASRAIQVQLGVLEKALREQNSHDFFVAARRVLQERLGEKTGMKPETITPSDLVDWSGRVNHASQDRLETIDQVRKIFEIADAVSYSGQRFSAESLGDWKQKVMHALKRLEKFQ